MTDVHQYVENYRFEFDGGGEYEPTDQEKAMIEDAIEGYIADLKYEAGMYQGLYELHEAEVSRLRVEISRLKRSYGEE